MTVFATKFNRSFEGFRIGQHDGVESASGFRMIDVWIVFDPISNGPGTAFADVENASASAALELIDGFVREAEEPEGVKCHSLCDIIYA